MKKNRGKLALIGLSALLGLLSMWVNELKLGIDLSGGTILVYEVRELPRGTTIDEMIAALKKRVDPEGVREIPIRPVGRDRIELILPRAEPEEVEDIKRKLTDVGSLEFRILANRKHDSAAIERALGPQGLVRPPSRFGWARLGEIISGSNPEFDARANTLTDPSQSWSRNKYAGIDIELTGQDASGDERTVRAPIISNTANTLVLGESPDLVSVRSYRIEYNPSGIQPGDDAIVRDEQVAPGRTERFILYRVPAERMNVTGAHLSRAFPEQDERLQPAVGFVFNREGARRFGALTRSHLPEADGFRYRLAIILDGIIMSAPVINSEIRERGIIEGGGQGFSPREVQHLVDILRAGSLPGTLTPTPMLEETVGPTLGEDTIRKGLIAIAISMLLVPVFMISYYRFAGAVAVFCLALNMILLIGTMAFFQATFTLPGLAGLALTIGMAVDANVLIFERMREERQRGANIAQQIRNGFGKAWSTILDANVTTMLAGVILFAVGTEEVKGFALILIIGLIWNLFSAVYVSRAIFDAFHQQGWLRRISMLRLLDKTNIDFVGRRRWFMLASAVVIALGLAAFGTRVGDNTMFNIDFTGGTLVTIRLNDQAEEVRDLSDPARAAFVRQRAGVLPDVTVESVNVRGEQTGIRFNIRTTEADVPTVQQAILGSFGPALSRVELTVGESEPIPAARTPARDEDEAPALTDRFAGGMAYTLRFNVRQPPSRVADAFAEVLRVAGVANPETRLEVINPELTPDTPPDTPTDTLVLRTNLEPDEASSYLTALTVSMRDDPSLLFERLTNFGSTVAGETREKAILAIIASWIVIAAYLWLRFKSISFGLAAVLAVIHDVLLTLGAVSVTYWLANVPGLGAALMLEPFKIDLPMTAAFLTLIGFSVNDTIVIFDRIREIKGKTPYLTADMVNSAINQTLSRTIITSLTTWLVVVILYVFGGEGLHGFAFCLVIGFLTGTYSTIFIAAPVLIEWAGKKAAPKAPKDELITSR